MKFNYTLSNVCGSVYSTTGANLLFTNDSRTLISPCKNQIKLFDLINNTSTTLGGGNIYTYTNIQHICLNHANTLLIAIDITGRALIINWLRRHVIMEFNFAVKNIRVCQFTPDDRHFVVGINNTVQMYHTPALIQQSRSLVLSRTISTHQAAVTCVDFTPDSKYMVTGSADLTCHIHAIQDRRRFRTIQLIGHRSRIIGTFVAQIYSEGVDRSTTKFHVYTVGANGSIYVYEWIPATDDEVKQHAVKQEHAAATRKSHRARQPVGAVKQFKSEQGSFLLVKKYYLRNNDNSDIASAQVHRIKSSQIRPTESADSNDNTSLANLLVVGFHNGSFGIYELSDELSELQTLSIANNHTVDTIAINPAGDWLAFGSARLGQLLVYEWQSETYALKQQNHEHGINCCDFSADGQLVVTGGDDAKLKLWNILTGFCYITFAQHTAPVTCVQFNASGNVVYSASRDGTIRCYDLVHYRCFRTLVSPTATQFISLAVDTTGEIVCAGTVEPYTIYVWSLKTGKLIDQLNGHTGPVCSLSFNHSDNILASASWDKTVRLWNIFSGDGCVDTYEHTADILCVAYRPDGKQLCTSTLDGNLNFWNTETGVLESVIEGKNDIQGGRRQNDMRAAANNTHATCFTTVTYSADGSSILCGGNSKFVCIYDIATKILVKKLSLTNNHSLDGVDQFLNSRNVDQFGQVRVDVDDNDTYTQNKLLPGAQTGDLSSRSVKPLARCKQVRFNPTNQQFAAATTEGLLLYTLNEYVVFAPTELHIDCTPQSVVAALKKQHFSKALNMALQLNDIKCTELCVDCTPLSSVHVCVTSLNKSYIAPLLRYLTQQLHQSAQLHYLLIWCEQVLTIHSVYLAQQRNTLNTSSQYQPVYRELMKGLLYQYSDIEKLANSNKYALDYIASFDMTETVKLGATTTGIKVKQKLLTAEEWAALDEQQADGEEDDSATVKHESNSDHTAEALDMDTDDNDEVDAHVDTEVALKQSKRRRTVNVSS